MEKQQFGQGHKNEQVFVPVYFFASFCIVLCCCFETDHFCLGYRGCCGNALLQILHFSILPSPLLPPSLRAKSQIAIVGHCRRHFSACLPVLIWERPLYLGQESLYGHQVILALHPPKKRDFVLQLLLTPHSLNLPQPGSPLTQKQISARIKLV